MNFQIIKKIFFVFSVILVDLEGVSTISPTQAPPTY